MAVIQTINRHKRLLIPLAAVLALSAGLWWMMRPVIDPRLVGTWQSDRFPHFLLEFNADGRGFVHNGRHQSDFYWSANRGIRYGRNVRSIVDDVIEAISARRLFRSQRAEIEVLDDGHFRLQEVRAGSVAETYTRIPEFK